MDRNKPVNWDQRVFYEIFIRSFYDSNGDGVGDTPYELYAYADQIWIETPAAQFFKTAPVLELLDFLERLAPFSSPELQLRDPSPRFAKPGSLPHS